jgi:hypothetical protein
LDLWIQAERNNARLLLEALAALGAPTVDVTPDDFTHPEIFFQIGVDPVRVDIMTSVTGLDFDTAWGRRIIVDFNDVPGPVLCRADILAAKIAPGRLRERRDAWRLRGD